jgi:hypothetical protein
MLHYIHAYVSIRQHTSAYASIRQHTSAYVSIRQHTPAYVSIRRALSNHAQASRSTIYTYTYTCIVGGTFASWRGIDEAAASCATGLHRRQPALLGMGSTDGERGKEEVLDVH